MSRKTNDKGRLLGILLETSLFMVSDDNVCLIQLSAVE